eukprot:TRINITY_DN9663_c0_g1_i1.p1 TRINITY_DN9663_c0_g1~~TRINITY_DN9663_c0_g1_i1.p1  ORF type:complete len:561 (-),score=-15.01 TRINITY_DN9663_c0_g1_i1:103-1785(-)
MKSPPAHEVVCSVRRIVSPNAFRIRKPFNDTFTNTSALLALRHTNSVEEIDPPLKEYVSMRRRVYSMWLARCRVDRRFASVWAETPIPSFQNHSFVCLAHHCIVGPELFQSRVCAVSFLHPSFCHPLRVLSTVDNLPHTSCFLFTASHRARCQHTVSWLPSHQVFLSFFSSSLQLRRRCDTLCDTRSHVRHVAVGSSDHPVSKCVGSLFDMWQRDAHVIAAGDDVGREGVGGPQIYSPISRHGRFYHEGVPDLAMVVSETFRADYVSRVLDHVPELALPEAAKMLHRFPVGFGPNGRILLSSKAFDSCSSRRRDAFTTPQLTEGRRTANSPFSQMALGSWPSSNREQCTHNGTSEQNVSHASARHDQTASALPQRRRRIESVTRRNHRPMSALVQQRRAALRMMQTTVSTLMSAWCGLPFDGAYTTPYPENAKTINADHPPPLGAGRSDSHGYGSSITVVPFGENSYVLSRAARHRVSGIASYAERGTKPPKLRPTPHLANDVDSFCGVQAASSFGSAVAMWESVAANESAANSISRRAGTRSASFRPFFLNSTADPDPL